MMPGWLVIIPPCFVLAIALLTRRLNVALGLGLISAAFIAQHGQFTSTAYLLNQRITQQLTDLDNVYLYSFLLLLGIIIVLIAHSGGAQAFTRLLKRKLNTQQHVEFATLGLSSVLFIDDYLSSLLTGYVMRPLTDHMRIARVKLAYLVHTMAGALVILAPVSSWTAMLTGQLDQVGIAPVARSGARLIGDPLVVMLRSTPYIFYSFFAIASAWFIVWHRISYGPMRTQEVLAQTTGNLVGGKEPIVERLAVLDQPHGQLRDLLIPLLTLVSTFLLLILYQGGYWALGGDASFLHAFARNTQTFFCLFVSSVVTLLVTLGLIWWHQLVPLADIPRLATSGINLMRTSVIMIFLASTLGIIMRLDLQTGSYIAHLLIGQISPSMMPALFYAISLLIATITGTAWGSIALMIPIAIPMLLSLLGLTDPIGASQVPLLFPLLGAIASGAVCGNHISPLAETTIMAAASSGAYPLDHAYTQIFYALPAIFTTSMAFLALAVTPISWTSNLMLCSGGIVGTFIIISLLNRMYSR